MSGLLAPMRRYRLAHDPALPPVILLGGDSANALSVAHSLGDRGVRVFLLGQPDGEAVWSRFAERLAVPPTLDGWASFLLGPESDRLRGSLLLTCSDDAIQFILDHRDALAEKYVLDLCNPEAQWCFLNKLSTYEAARAAGVPTPLFWRVDSVADVTAHKDEYVYPLIVKPLFSHRFKKVFTGKYFVTHDFGELLEAFAKVHEQGVEALLLEEIPGDDDRLCSCFTYLDERGEPLFEFTKRVIRRYPEHQGFACYHITDWEPEVFELGMRLVKQVGLLGLANVEFKRDHRDGKLKVIECNIRFTAANQILVASGYDLPWLVYSRLAGATPALELMGKPYDTRARLLFPWADLFAFVDLRAQGRMTTPAWIASLLHRQHLPYFRWDDPVPSLVVSAEHLRHIARGSLRRLARAARARIAPVGERE